MKQGYRKPHTEDQDRELARPGYALGEREPVYATPAMRRKLEVSGREKREMCTQRAMRKNEQGTRRRRGS
jgi:hypothetical protein